ncbi:MAG: hypothetical protein NZ933_04440 [Bacteroidia bacterium]|nr:hypothetical protein [Bacteroidia bacterium]
MAHYRQVSRTNTLSLIKTLLLYLSGCTFGQACRQSASFYQEPRIWRHWTIYPEIFPCLPVSCGEDSTPWAISLILRRDPLTGKVEWLSGHRYALMYALEQLPVQLILLEIAAEDSFFFPRNSVERTFFRESLEQWIIEEFIPFLGPYSIGYVAFGKGWTENFVSGDEWNNLLSRLRAQESSIHWGWWVDSLYQMASLEKWDFLVMTHSSDLGKVDKPLFLVQPNLKGVGEKTLKREGHTEKAWEVLGILAYQQEKEPSCP